MMKKSFLTILTIFLAGFLFAQKGTIRGVVRDATIGETLIGANVLISAGVGTITDFDGNFELEADYGEYNVQVSYVGYEAFSRKITISGKPVVLNIKLEEVSLNEILIVADVARSRETPVAFTNILPAKIEEELGGQDIPMILASTPGVHVTQQGGGDGDARITIRGFSQRNVAVMIDGIPVNDMENGWVYWSNWFGLDAVTRSMQVQRGLGASKLALPSVGGTINILTKGIENKRQFTLKQDINSEGKSTTSLGFTSGKLKNGWGFTLASTYKKGNGWVDETWSEAFFYYAKVDKRIGKHIISLSAMGAPQEHGQRSYKRALATYDLDYANQIGTIDSLPPQLNMGSKYNQQWGYVERYELGDIIDSVGGGFSGWTYIYDTLHVAKEKLHYKVNQYHKPAFSLRDFWNISDKLYISNIAYLSLGRGGGTSTKISLKDSDLDSLSGQINWQSFYNSNVSWKDYADLNEYGLDQSYTKSAQYRVMSMNDHFWYGLLSTFNYTPSNLITISGGIDLRNYIGTHYRIVYDLLGGDYAIDNYDANQINPVKYEGDKVYYHDDGMVKWGGIFGQIEHKTGIFSSFLNISTAYTGYKKIDYFKTPEDSLRETDWMWKPGFTIKGGSNYNINEQMNIFINLGYLSKTRASKYIYDGFDAKFREKTDNEIVKAAELGYSYSSSVIAFNINAYYTVWQDRPINDIRIKKTIPVDDPYADPSILGEEKSLKAQIPGIDALHKGIETDFVYKILPNLELQGLLSIGDWTWTSMVENAKLYTDDGDRYFAGYFDFDPRGVHVGDAAQIQYAASLRYKPFKKMYVNLKWLYHDKYFSDLEPSSLNGSENATNEDGTSIDSWQIPKYSLFDLHTGYTFQFNEYRLSLKLSVFNLLNTFYISDAMNNDQYILPTTPSGFDTQSAAVFIGMGRRFNVSLKFSF